MSKVWWIFTNTASRVVGARSHHVPKREYVFCVRIYRFAVKERKVSMIETNIRIVVPGVKVGIFARRAKITSTTSAPDLVELACLRLRAKSGLAAVPDGDGLLVATDSPIPELK